MFGDISHESDPNQSLTDDLNWLADAVDGNHTWLQSYPKKVYAILRAGMGSEYHYKRTVEIVVEFIALVVTDDAWKTWFEPIVDLVATYPIHDGNLFETGLREVITDFRDLVGVYERLNSVRPVQVDELLQAYIKLFRVLTYKHAFKLPETLIDQSLQVAQELGDHMENAKLHQTLALYFVHYGDFDMAEPYAKLALNEYEFIEDFTGAVDAALTMAVICRDSLRFARAEYFIKRVIEMRPPTQHDKRFATLCYEFAVSCYLRGKYDLALSYYQRALTIFEDLGAPYQITMTWQALAQVYIRFRDFPKAAGLLLDARKQWEQLGNQYEWVNTFFVEADLELQRGDRSLGLKMLRHSVDVAYTTLEESPAREGLLSMIRDHIDVNSEVVAH